MATDGSGDVLVDTSAWINYLHGVEPSHSAVRRLCDSGRAVTTGIVLAELVVGARSDQQAARLSAIGEAVRVIEETARDWLAAADYVRRARPRGSQLSLSDCLIAAMAVRGGLSVMTTDRHFREIAQEFGVRLCSPGAAVG